MKEDYSDTCGVEILQNFRSKQLLIVWQKKHRYFRNGEIEEKCQRSPYVLKQKTHLRLTLNALSNDRIWATHKILHHGRKRKRKKTNKHKQTDQPTLCSAFLGLFNSPMNKYKVGHMNTYKRTMSSNDPDSLEASPTNLKIEPINLTDFLSISVWPNFT